MRSPGRRPAACRPRASRPARLVHVGQVDGLGAVQSQERDPVAGPGCGQGHPVNDLSSRVPVVRARRDVGGHGADGPDVVEPVQRDAHPVLLAQAGEDAGGGQGVAAEVEEVAVRRQRRPAARAAPRPTGPARPAPARWPGPVRRGRRKRAGGPAGPGRAGPGGRGGPGPPCRWRSAAGCRATPPRPASCSRAGARAGPGGSPRRRAGSSPAAARCATSRPPPRSPGWRTTTACLTAGIAASRVSTSPASIR